MKPSPKAPADRILGFDVLRFVSFIAIAYFHIAAIHFQSNQIEFSNHSVVVKTIETYARSLVFSGFTVLFLTSFLAGLHEVKLRQRLKLWAFLGFGWVALCLLIHAPVSPLRTWDIYLLIVLGLGSADGMRLLGAKATRCLAVVGFLMCWLPIAQLGPLLGEALAIPPLWQSVLGLADCSYSISEWPILPWTGFIWFAYGAGSETASRLASGHRFEIGKAEAWTWVAFFALSLPRLGDLYSVELMEFFRCGAYKQHPYTFWSHLIWPLAVMRLSLDPRVRQKLATQAWAHWIASLAISRKFWLAYAGHYVLALAISRTIKALRLEGTSFYDAVIIGVALVYLPVIELSLRATIAVYRATVTRWQARTRRAVDP